MSAVRQLTKAEQIATRKVSGFISTSAEIVRIASMKKEQRTWPRYNMIVSLCFSADYVQTLVFGEGMGLSSEAAERFALFCCNGVWVDLDIDDKTGEAKVCKQQITETKGYEG